MQRNEQLLYTITSIFIVCLLLAGVLIERPSTILPKLVNLQTQSARLINDFTLYGFGTAMVNAASVGLLALLAVYVCSVSLSGPTLAAVLTVIGFSFFGNTVLNCLPIIFGVRLASLLARKTFGAYILITLFGTALGPLVTLVMFGLDLPLLLSIPLGLITGLAVGFILPAVAGSMLQLHQGYNLYNVGFSCGFLGLFAASLLLALGKGQSITVAWNTAFSLPLVLVIPLFCLVLVICALIIEKPRRIAKGFLEIQKLSGRLPYDFFDTESEGGVLLNMALLGLLAWLYVLAIGGPINGPIIGGILTIMGFAGFGKTIRNTVPVVVGAIAATLLFSKPLTAPGPLLAALFCTTLAPIAGQFGIIAGVLAGFTHLVMVEVTAGWHAGLDLYNNGFAGGLTASLFIAIIQWYKTNRPKEDFKL